MPTTSKKGGSAKKSGGGRMSPTQYFKAGTWVCPRCNNSVDIPVKMTAPPSCSNHKGNGVAVMELKGKK